MFVQTQAVDLWFCIWIDASNTPDCVKMHDCAHLHSLLSVFGKFHKTPTMYDREIQGMSKLYVGSGGLFLTGRGESVMVNASCPAWQKCRKHV